MRTINEGFLRVGKVALIIDVTTDTLYRWYRWWECEEFEKPDDLVLPPYYRLDRRGTKWFKESDIPMLLKFKEQIRTQHRGIMSEFNAAMLWGKRGDRALKNKQLDKIQVKNKLTV